MSQEPSHFEQSTMVDIHSGRKMLTISEAARNLKVSERTIYRMIGSGALKQVRASGGNGRYVNFVTGKILYEKEILVDELTKMSNMSDNSNANKSSQADIPTEDSAILEALNMECASLRIELEAKEAQIRNLITTQQELAKSVQRFQEQMYELARLALQQPLSTAEGASNSMFPGTKSNAKPSLFARFFHKR